MNTVARHLGISLCLLGAAGIAAGCGKSESDDGDAPAGTSGNSGQAGSAGTAGRGGKAGNAGDAGRGGNAGNSGNAGNGGNAGGAGRGGNAGNSGNAGNGGTGENAGEGGNAGNAGNPAGNGGDAGDGGAVGSEFPCGSAEPVLDESTGFERCSRGYVRRPRVGECSSQLPRSEPIPNYNPAIDECEYDANCDELAHGHCGTREGGYGRVCVSGCLVDADCDDGRICLCGEPVGRCVPATCTTDADCTPGFDCASYEAAAGCFTTQFACQIPDDRCAGDADCLDFSPNPAFCHVDGMSRSCTIVQCTTP